MDMKIFEENTNNCFGQSETIEISTNNATLHDNNEPINTNWNCTACTFSNPAQSVQCEICDTPKATQSTWSCNACTYNNTSDMESCEMCGTDKPNPTTSNPKQCDHLNRILHALKYYRLLDLENNPSNHHIFANFCNVVYPQLLNDYQHIISTHSDQLEAIHEQLIKDDNFGECDLLKCALFRRHQENSRRQTASNEEKPHPKFSYCAELLDATHYWLFHLFQVGMRTKGKTVESGVDDDDKQIDDDYIDHEFKRIKDSIDQARGTANIGRDRSGVEGNKFQLNLANTHDDTNTDQHATTFIDTLLQSMKAEKAPLSRDLFKNYVQSQEYDSDAVVDDLIDYAAGSNILDAVDDANFSRFLVDFIAEFKSLVSLHSVHLQTTTNRQIHLYSTQIQHWIRLVLLEILQKWRYANTVTR